MAVPNYLKSTVELTQTARDFEKIGINLENKLLIFLRNTAKLKNSSAKLW